MRKLALLLLLLCGPVSGATITAASCSTAHIQTAVDSAVSGDIVNVPAGSCTWTSTVNIVSKNITLRGAGVGNTVITAANGTIGIRVGSAGTGNSSRVTGFEMTGAYVVVDGDGWRVVRARSRRRLGSISLPGTQHRIC